MNKNELNKLFESVYTESTKLTEERSKRYYKGFWKDSSGEFQSVPKDVEEAMNQLTKVPAMEEFLKKKYKDRDVKVEEDTSIGW